MEKLKNRKIELICAIVLVLSSITCILGYIFHIYLEEPEIKLNGNEEITIELKEDFKDPGVTAVLSEKDITKDVKVKGKIDNTKIGEYELIYSVTNTKGKKKREVIRKIKVVDKKNPEIKLKGNISYKLNYASTYKEYGYKATDNYDGDITNKVKVSGEVNSYKLGTYQLTYSVEDSSGNKTKKTRTIKIVLYEKTFM